MNFPREIGLKRTICDNLKQFNDYVGKLNGKSNCYTSLYAFKNRRTDMSWKFDVDSAIIDRAWWDFDEGERGDIQSVKTDVCELIQRLGDTRSVRLVATGRGFHVHQLFKRPVTGREWHEHLGRYQRQMANGLKTLDGVGFPAKLTRIPDTYNVTRNRWAVNIPVEAFLSDCLHYPIPTTPNNKHAVLDPFTGDLEGVPFDIVKWVADNPKQDVELQAFEGEIGSAGEVPIPPCLERAVKHDNPKHDVRVALVQTMAEELRWFTDPTSLSQSELKEMEDTIFNYIKGLGWRDFNEYRSRLGIRTNLGYSRSPSCRWFNVRGMCKGKCWRYDGTI